MSNRDSFFDNAKVLLIFLVVFGHFIQSYIDSDLMLSSVYKFIYTFHMPAFILISGYFAKGIYEKGYVWRITKRLIVPYLIFQLVYSIFYFFLHNKQGLTINLLNPHWSLWFLISLFCWNLMLLTINYLKLKPGTALSIVILLGLFAGYADWISNYLSLSRTIVFFPFFLIGYYLDKGHFKVLQSRKLKVPITIFMIVIALIIICFPDLNEKWLFGSKPYGYFEDVKTVGLLKRTGLYMIQLAMVGSFFAFVPRGRYFFTSWGKNTLYVYLLHGFIVRTFRGSNVEEYFSQTQTLPILLLLSLTITALFSSKYIKKATEPMIELRFNNWRRFASIFVHLFRRYTNQRHSH